MVTEVVKGGLILGRRHSEGGIKMMQIVNGEVYRIGEMEGGEYLINCFATKNYVGRLEEINNYYCDADSDIPEEEIKNCRHYIIPPGHWIIVSAQPFMIVNRAATKKHLNELDEINESTVYMFSSDMVNSSR